MQNVTEQKLRQYYQHNKLFLFKCVFCLVIFLIQAWAVLHFHETLRQVVADGVQFVVFVTFFRCCQIISKRKEVVKMLEGLEDPKRIFAFFLLFNNVFPIAIVYIILVLVFLHQGIVW